MCDEAIRKVAQPRQGGGEYRDRDSTRGGLHIHFRVVSYVESVAGGL